MIEPKRVLVVDDSRVARFMLRRFIQTSFSDWEIFEADSGEQALADIGVVQPDVVTMDINMKGMSGLDAAEAILHLFPQIWVVLITANIQESSRLKAEEIGASFLQKPVTEAAIKAALDAYLAGTLVRSE